MTSTVARRAPRVAGFGISDGRCRAVVREAESGALVREAVSDWPNGDSADPGELWRALGAAFDAVEGLRDVRAFSIAAPSGGLVVLDEAGGVIGRARLDGEPLTLLERLRVDDPAAAARVEAVLTAHDWLLWRLRGYGEGLVGPYGAFLEELVTSTSQARCTGYWDESTHRWRHTLVERVLGHAVIKPRVMSRSDSWAGESAKSSEHGLPQGRVIGIGATVRAAAALGAGRAADSAGPSITTSPDDAANGMALQAAWALRRRRPDWPLPPPS